MSDDLRVAARGVGWNYLGSGATLAAQVLYTALTARLVSPAGFGAYAAAQTLVAVVGYFGLATIGNAVVRHPRDDRRIAGTAFLISLAAGAVASAAVFLCAPVWAGLWNVPQSETVARLFSLVVLLSAFGYVPLALLRRALDYRRAALIEAAGQIGGTGVGAATAFMLHSPSALVLGQAAAAGLTAGAAVVASRRLLTPSFSWSEARSLLRFSGQVSGQNLLYYGLYSAPSLIVSRLFGAVALGGYSRANVMVTLPVTHLWVGITKTLYPLVARAREDSLRLRELIESTLRTTVGLSWPLFAAVAGASPLVVRVLLGSRWSGVAELVPPIVVFGAVNLAYVVAGNPVEVLAYQRVIWRVQLFWVALLATALLASGLAHVSVQGLLWVVAAVQVVVHLVKLRVTAQLGLLRLRAVLHDYALAIALSAAFYAGAAAVERASGSIGSVAGRALVELLAVAALVALTTVFLPSTVLARAVRSGIAFGCASLGFGRVARQFPLAEPRHAHGER